MDYIHETAETTATVNVELFSEGLRQVTPLERPVLENIVEVLFGALLLLSRAV